MKRIDMVVRVLVIPLLLTGCGGKSLLGSLDEAGTDGDDETAGDGQTSQPGEDTNDTGEDTSPGDTGEDIDPPTNGPPRIDFLFVIDNSGSMGTAQGQLVAGVDAFVAGLDAAGEISYRIGVTTTDNGNPWCGSTGPEAGQLQLSSCRDRTGEFVFNGVPPMDATQVACLDVCTLDDIPILPTATEVDPNPAPRPWIQGGPGGSNLDGVSVADALRCTMPQGIAGCGFESQLESMHKAVVRATTPGESSYGFIRSDAHLVVVFVTDEVDCSYNNDFQSIFLPANMGGAPTFWTDPESPAPTSGVCWNAGVVCTGSGTPFEECHATNKDVDGNIDVPESDTVLQPLSRYRDLLDGLQDVKRTNANASVFLFGILGVPPGYPATPITYQEAGDPVEWTDFAIGPGCTNEDGIRARPPVRIRELVESFDNPVNPSLYSICGDIPQSLDPILQSVLAHVQ